MTRTRRLSFGTALAVVSVVPASAYALNLGNFVGGQIVRMNYASDGVTVGGTYDFNIVGLQPSTGSIGFLNMVADLNFNNNIEPQEWVVQNIPLPLTPDLLQHPLLSTWFDPGPFNLQPGAPYRTAATLEPEPLEVPLVDPSWHNSIVPANQHLWGGNDPAGQSLVFIPPIPIPPIPPIEAFKRKGVPDIAQQTNECGPTSAANSLRWLADVHGFGAQLPASNDDLIKDLMKAMTGSDARPFPGLTDNQLYDGKKKYIKDKKLPIVVKGGNTSQAASGASAFKFIKEELAAGEDVEFLIAWPGGGSHWVTAVGYGVIGNRLFLEVNDPDDGKTGPVDWELKPDGTFVNPRGRMLWAVSESYSPIFDWVPTLPSPFWSLANWSAPGIPDAVEHQAYFSGGGIVGGIGLVELDGDRTVNAVTFYNPTGSYQFTSGLGSTLHLDDGYGEGTIRHDSPSTNFIGVRVASPQTLWVDLYDPAGTLRMATIDTPVLRTNGPGTLEIESDLSPGRTTVVHAGAGLTQFNSTQHLRELHVRDGARVGTRALGTDVIVTEILALSLTGQANLNNNRMIVDYPPSSPTPLPMIRALLTSGYAGGGWNGPGLGTALGDASQFALGYAEATDLFTTFPATFVGEPIDSTSVLVRYTRYGDANLNGQTTIADFAILASNFNAAGPWARGDFNFDLMIGIADFALLAGNFHQSASDTPAAAGPEPAHLAVAVMVAGLSRRRRAAA